MSRPFRPFAVAFLGISLSLALLVGGCPQTPGGGSSGAAELKPFDSAGDLLSYLKQQATARRSFNFGIAPLAGGAELATDADNSEQGTGDGTVAGGDYSTTNIQEIGVDESDVFKSDGTYFYIADGDVLRIVQADPLAELAERATLNLDSRIDSLYLFGDTVITLGTLYGGYGDDEPEILIWPPYYASSTAVITQIDVSDPANPTVLARVELDGVLVSSRLTNGRLIVILTVQPDLPDTPTRLAVSTLTLDDVMPKIRRDAQEAEAVPWENWLRPASPDGCNMTAVMTLDAADIETVVESVAVLANAGTIYASPDALYLTDADYDPDDNYRQLTVVHKLAFDEDGAARYVASGSVPGRLLNQFSLGECEGYLRLATHVDNFSLFPVGAAFSTAVSSASDGVAVDDLDTAQAITSGVPYNGVYVLGQVEDRLEVAGFVDGLAPNEEIHSARFMGDRGFLVTFQKVDPLFVLDLADPANPQVVGELKIPGYSDYLHPLGEDHLLGVGNSVVPAGWGGVWWNKLQLSLFDVSDLTNPTLVQQIEVGGFRSWSDVRDDHKAFTLVTRGEQTLLALPAELTPDSAGPESWTAPEFRGVLCFDVDVASGFTELGRLAAVGEAYEYWWTPWCRAALIGDVLYTLTTDGVRAAPLGDFAATQTVTFVE
ncbi:MAG: beta-propeller domain-containing protein [Phycisphaerae bacterium]